MVQMFTISGRIYIFGCTSGKIAVNGSVLDQDFQLFEEEEKIGLKHRIVVSQANKSHMQA